MIPPPAHCAGGLALVLALWPLGTALGQEAGSAAPIATRLQRLDPAPLLLAPPAGVAAGVAIAQEAPVIEFAVFPGQWAGARLWSSWGDALFAADGSFYASIGDHGAPHGTAYVYRIDPVEGLVEQVVDFNAIIGADDPSRYSPGKIHGGLVQGPEDGIYFFGYRGSEGSTTAEVGYRGDWLLRYDPARRQTENLGMPLADCSVPVLLYDPATQSLTGLSAPGRTAAEPHSRFFRFSLAEKKLVFHGGPEPNLSRALVLAADGRAWYSHRNPAGEDVLVRYDPQTNAAVVTAARVPGSGQLRAASQPDGAGVAWCISMDGALFAFDTQTETVRETGPCFSDAPLYTAACRLDRGGRYLYYVPGAHGGTDRHGTALIQFDTTSGQRKVLAFLNETVRQSQGYNLGGTYGLALNADGSRLFIGFNGAPVGNKEPDFGLCSALVVHIPASERPAD